jgi:xanthine dehydrogenase YagT iron-sulfur-binding subunit
VPFSNWTRREFLGTSLKAGAVVSTVPAVLQGQDSTEDGATATRGPNIEGAVPITLHINGKDRQLSVDPRTTLLDCLRETVALTGTKKGCDHGQCGAWSRAKASAQPRAHEL